MHCLLLVTVFVGLSVHRITQKLSADYTLFTTMCTSWHCLHFLLPPVNQSSHYFREITHSYQLPNCQYNFFHNSFAIHSLYNFLVLNILMVFIIIGIMYCFHVFVNSALYL